MSKWRYKLAEDFELTSPYLIGVTFDSHWVIIRNARIFIRKGYAWDGCTPSYRIPMGEVLPKGLWLGIWDGPSNTQGMPSTMKATLVHDALCQYRNEIQGMTKENSIALFKQLMHEYESPSWLANLYALGLNLFGPKKWQ